jgi:hypothetical protein
MTAAAAGNAANRTGEAMKTNKTTTISKKKLSKEEIKAFSAHVMAPLTVNGGAYPFNNMTPSWKTAKPGHWHRYQMFRPFSFAAVPPGFIEGSAKNLQIKAGNYGSIAYPKKLSDELIAKFSLMYLGPETPPK